MGQEGGAKDCGRNGGEKKSNGPKRRGKEWGNYKQVRPTKNEKKKTLRKDIREHREGNRGGKLHKPRPKRNGSTCHTTIFRWIIERKRKEEQEVSGSAL